MLYYLSFSDEQFLGGAFVEADSEQEAGAKPHTLGFFPKGNDIETVIVPCPDTYRVPAEAMDRLVPLNELKTIFAANGDRAVWLEDGKEVSDNDRSYGVGPSPQA